MSTNKNIKTTETTQPQVEKNAQSGLVVRSSVRAGSNGKPRSANRP